MKKRKILGLLAVVIILFAFAGQAGAFCVHNYSDTAAWFVEVSGGDFNKTLRPNESACCHWSNEGCNPGDKYSPLGFSVSITTGGGGGFYVCDNVKIPACSDLDLTGSGGNYRCVAHGTETCY